MIDENALSYKRGDLVEFELSLGGGPKRCTALVLNTGVLMGRAARQVWIVDIKDPTPGQETAWLNKKHLVHETQISCRVPAVFIGRDTLLRDNPVSFPIKNFDGESETSAVMVSVALPVRVPPEEAQPGAPSVD